jgi:hypothetical protein
MAFRFENFPKNEHGRLPILIKSRAEKSRKMRIDGSKKKKD